MHLNLIFSWKKYRKELIAAFFMPIMAFIFGFIVCWVWFVLPY